MIIRYFHLGRFEYEHYYVTLRLEETPKSPSLLQDTRIVLSMTGEVPNRFGTDLSQCGQMQDTIKYVIKKEQFEFDKKWTIERVNRLLELWDRWHLNDARPWCPHQFEEGWHKRPINPNLLIDTYGHHLGKTKTPTWNMLVWVNRKEHPDGLLGEPCSKCGYKYGTSWLYEEIPQNVIDELLSFPEEQEVPGIIK